MKETERERMCMWGVLGRGGTGQKQRDDGTSDAIDLSGLSCCPFPRRMAFPAFSLMPVRAAGFGKIHGSTPQPVNRLSEAFSSMRETAGSRRGRLGSNRGRLAVYDDVIERAWRQLEIYHPVQTRAEKSTNILHLRALTEHTPTCVWKSSV
ncbi:uncharacterized [Tachysurus ichikawai]